MGKKAGWMVGGVIILGLLGGCQGGTSLGSKIASWWRSTEDEEYRLLLESIDEYARKNGLTRREAIRQLREEADRYAMQQRQQTTGAFYQAGNPSQSVPSGFQRPSAPRGGSQASWLEPAQQRPSPSARTNSSSFSR